MLAVTLCVTARQGHLNLGGMMRSYIIVYLKFSAGNYSIAGKRGHWPASEDISLPYLTLPFWKKFF